jgi:hypothetical protein
MAMTDLDYRHYLLIVDRSGSMASIKAEAQEGIRHFASEHAALPGRATLTLCQFDDVHEIVHDQAPLAAVASYELAPRGMTALLDACGMAITRTGARLAALPEHERPGKVIVLIVTDGYENASREYARQQVRDLITGQQRDYGWQFSYVGANVDAFAEAESLGIAGPSSLDFAASAQGARSAYKASSAASLRYASGQSANISYTDEERKKAAQE